MFLTGAAGSGKSFLLQEFLKEKNRKTHAVVASTGAAAVLVGGVTFHSFFGLGILEGGLEKTVSRALKDKRLKKRLERTQLVVIDEISMISGKAMVAAEMICRNLRSKSVPWGGIKIIAVGDFGQLPPVNAYGAEKDWAFQSDAWNLSHFKVAYLKTLVRTVDGNFLEVLNYVRNGEINAQVTDFLNSRMREIHPDFSGTHIFPHRHSVERFNLDHLKKLNGTSCEFETAYSGAEKYIDQIRRTAPVPEVLCLKEGALVMIRKNDPRLRFVNGTLGKIKKLDSHILKIELISDRNGAGDDKQIAPQEVELERETFSYLDPEGEVVASATNFPVNLAWATTIHKCQGMTLNSAVVDLSRVFEAGQAYVALSRIRSAQGLYLTGWSAKSIRVAPEVRAFHAGLNRQQ